jgi:hypothetical protein
MCKFWPKVLLVHVLAILVFVLQMCKASFIFNVIGSAYPFSRGTGLIYHQLISFDTFRYGYRLLQVAQFLLEITLCFKRYDHVYARSYFLYR